MNNKRGHTEKIRYPFPSHRCCEVEIEGVFYRTTPNEFRSWGGGRRILNTDSGEYESYNGPIYYLGTNIKVPKKKQVKMINFLNGVDPRHIGKKRRYEKF